jgi:hypothetical protein
MSLDILTSVGTAIKLAWKIYEKGFTKEKSSRSFTASRQMAIVLTSFA